MEQEKSYHWISMEQTQYLLDTNIIVFLFRGNVDICQKLNSVGKENCFISEVTVAELQYGVECSAKKEYNARILQDFLQDTNVIPFKDAINCFASEKAKLKKVGLKIDDFDLLIGCTAKQNNLTVVTDNIKHFQRIDDIHIENWIQRL